MMAFLNTALVLLSALSFLMYGVVCLTSVKMKNEFKKFGLEKFATLTGILEICGGIGLLVGLKFETMLIISSGGLSLLMLFGLAFRFKSGDRLLNFVPAFLFMILNGYLFVISLF